MASFSAKSKDLEPVYAQFSGDLFALCFLYPQKQRGHKPDADHLVGYGVPGKKPSVWLCRGRKAFRATYGGCMDYFLRKARKMPNAEELRKANVPFPLTDSLLSLLQLPYGSKAPCSSSCSWALPKRRLGKLLDRSPAAVRHGLDKALKRAGLGREKRRKPLWRPCCERQRLAAGVGPL